jgi:vitamin B12 transporter
MAQKPQRDTLSLTSKIHQIDEVVVTGARHETDVRHLSQTVSVVGRAQIESALQPSLLPVLTEQVPGLFVTSRGIMGYGVSTGAAGGISLRGLSGGTARLMVMIDGHPQYAGIFGHPIADAYQSFLAERVEVLRGPASVLYGSNAMGGVINIVTRKMQEDGVDTHLHAGYGSYNTLETELTNRVRKERFSSVVSGSYNRTDGHRTDMGFEQYGGYAKLGYEVAEHWNLHGDVNVTHFNASYPGPITAPLLDGDHMMGVSLYQSSRFFKGNRITFGFDWFRYGGHAWNEYVSGENAGTSADLVDKQEDELAGYVDLRQDIRSWLTFNAGLRVDHHSRVGTEWVPQVGLAFHLPQTMELKASASKGFRYPILREMYMFPPQNPDLQPESMWNYELAFSQRLMNGRLQYGVNLFFIDGKNLIQTLPNPNGSGMLNQNSGEIENAGVEVQAAYRIDRHWSVDGNYSYLHMKNPVIAAPEHKLYAGTSFSRGRWNVSTGLQYIAGLYTQTDPVVTEDFVLWNLRATFRVNRWLDIWACGENLLAQKYEINAGYPMPRATVMTGINLNF